MEQKENCDKKMQYNPSPLVVGALTGSLIGMALVLFSVFTGEIYSPAMAALIKERDDKTDLVKSGKGDCFAFLDVIAINRTLQEDSRTIELLRILDKDYPSLAQECRTIALSSLESAEDD